MTNQAFLTLLIDMLAKTVPADEGQAGTAREAGLTIARTLLEAWQPADAMEAALAARAIAAYLAAMDSFARAAKPGLSDEKAIRLRGNAIAAGRVFDNLLRTFRRPAARSTPVRADTTGPPASPGACPAASACQRVRQQHGSRSRSAFCACNDGWPLIITQLIISLLHGGFLPRCTISSAT